MDTNPKKQFLIGAAYYGVIFAIIFISYRIITKYLWPFLIAFLLVIVLRKPSETLAQKLKIKTKYVNILFVLASFILIFLLIFIIVSVITKKIEQADIMIFFENIMGGVNKLTNRAEKYLPDALKTALTTFVTSVPQKIGEMMPSVIGAMVSSLPKILLGFAVTVAAGCYFANEYEPLKNFFLSVVSKEKITLIKNIKGVMGKNVLRLLKGYVIIAFIKFLICFFAFLLLKNKHAFLWALFIAAVDLLPVLGAGSVLVPWGIISFLGGNYLYGFVLIVVYLVTVVIHHILEPKVVGARVGVPPLIALLVMFTALKVFGFLGMLTAILALVTVVNLYKNDNVAN